MIANLNYAQCAEHFGYGKSTICDLHHKYLTTGSVDDLPTSGRPACLSETDKKKLLEEIKEPYASSRSVAPHFDISHTSVANFAHESGINFRHFIEIPKLNDKHKLKRFEYCDKYFFENFDKWIFADANL